MCLLRDITLSKWCLSSCIFVMSHVWFEWFVIHLISFTNVQPIVFNRGDFRKCVSRGGLKVKIIWWMGKQSLTRKTIPIDYYTSRVTDWVKFHTNHIVIWPEWHWYISNFGVFKHFNLSLIISIFHQVLQMFFSYQNLVYHLSRNNLGKGIWIIHTWINVPKNDLWEVSKLNGRNATKSMENT